MTPRPPRLRGKRGFTHARVWWLLNDNGNCQPASAFRDVRAIQETTYHRMLAGKNTQTKDIAQARKRVTEVKTRGCDFD